MDHITQKLQQMRARLDSPMTNRQSIDSANEAIDLLIEAAIEVSTRTKVGDPVPEPKPAEDVKRIDEARKIEEAKRHNGDDEAELVGATQSRSSSARPTPSHSTSHTPLKRRA